MVRLVKALPAAALLAAVAGLFAGTARAAVSISPGGAITAVSPTTVTFYAGIVAIRCRVALTGTLATSASTGGGVAGSITAATVGGCAPAGTAVTLLTPIPIRLGSVFLTDDGIAELFMDFDNPGISVTLAGMTCLYQGSDQVHALVPFVVAMTPTGRRSGRTSATLPNLAFDRNSIPLASGTGCPTSGSIGPLGTPSLSLTPAQTLTLTS